MTSHKKHLHAVVLGSGEKKTDSTRKRHIIRTPRILREESIMKEKDVCRCVLKEREMDVELSESEREG